MLWIIYQMLKGFHILLAIIWVGGVLFVGWGVYPAIRKMTFSNQRVFLSALMKHTHWLYTLAGTGVILTGVILGTVLGPIKHWSDIWNTSYGNTWISAFIIAIFTLSWGVFVGYKQASSVLSNDTIWDLAENGVKKPLYLALLKTAAVESVEGIGFIVLLTLMMLL